ncbi:MAG: SocA family protein [Candidatus Omnitrophica bacterium]|nr:SocA family protein [Candidatus Omnitrophota bacterium]
MSKLKICKLLYFADKHHLIRYGRPILGDVYYHLGFGPIPSVSLDIMDEVIEGNSNGADVSNKMKFEEYLTVHKPFFSKYPVFGVKKPHALDCLSDSEREALSRTMETYGKLTPGALIDLTHGEIAWKNTPDNSPIDYRLFFEGSPDADPRAKEYMEAVQENIEVVMALK